MFGFNTLSGGLPGGAVVENAPASAGDPGDGARIPESGRAPGGGRGNSSILA